MNSPHCKKHSKACGISTFSLDFKTQKQVQNGQKNVPYCQKMFLSRWHEPSVFYLYKTSAFSRQFYII